MRLAWQHSCAGLREETFALCFAGGIPRDDTAASETLEAGTLTVGFCIFALSSCNEKQAHYRREMSTKVPFPKCSLF